MAGYSSHGEVQYEEAEGKQQDVSWRQLSAAPAKAGEKQVGISWRSH